MFNRKLWLRDYCKKYPERIKKYRQKYYKKHKKQLRIQHKVYNDANKLKMKEYWINYYLTHKTKWKKRWKTTKRSKKYKDKLIKMRESRHSKRMMLRKLNLTLDDFDGMVKEQNNRCAICNKKQIGKSLALDHNHKTGKIRGLLCVGCNCALGSFKDNIGVLKSAIRYLEKHNEIPSY